jgi:hypothetical protein
MRTRRTPILVAILLASLSALPAAESPATVANAERMPAFSWDRVPLYLHIRKDTAFTDDEIKHLATFPLITFDDNLRLVLSPRLKAALPQRAVADNFGAYAGEPLQLPDDAALPDLTFLAEHRKKFRKS